jgi:hypothetical protein
MLHSLHYFNNTQRNTIVHNKYYIQILDIISSMVLIYEYCTQYHIDHHVISTQYYNHRPKSPIIITMYIFLPCKMTQSVTSPART